MKPLSPQFDVLVVGAGPCGLAAALTLAKAGASVGVVDRAWKTSGESFACGLHPSTLPLLRDLGLGQPARDAGLCISGVGLYEQGERKAALALPETPESRLRAPWVLPQDQLEAQLEAELLRRGVRIHWGHRLDSVEQDADGVSAVVEEIGFNSVGYPFPRTEEAVTRVRKVRTHLLLAADGAESHVRQCLGISVETFGTPRVYDMIEARAESSPGNELRVTFHPGGVDGFWPLPGWRCRWSLEVGTGPDAQRVDAGSAMDARAGAAGRLEALSQRIRQRAPWYDAGLTEAIWQAQVVFRRQLSASLGRGRIWLAGDAAHQATPLGMHSMNLGLSESIDLATRMAEFLAGRASLDVFQAYEEACRADWKRWLGTETGIRMAPGAAEWVRHRRHQILMALPASGPDLRDWAAVLGMVLP